MRQQLWIHMIIANNTRWWVPEVSAHNLETHHGCVERKRTKEKGSKARDEKEEVKVKREREEMSAVRGSPPVSWQTNACHWSRSLGGPTPCWHLPQYFWLPFCDRTVESFGNTGSLEITAVAVGEGARKSAAKVGGEVGTSRDSGGGEFSASREKGGGGNENGRCQSVVRTRAVMRTSSSFDAGCEGLILATLALERWCISVRLFLGSKFFSEKKRELGFLKSSCEQPKASGIKQDIRLQAHFHKAPLTLSYGEPTRFSRYLCAIVLHCSLRWSSKK